MLLRNLLSVVLVLLTACGSAVRAPGVSAPAMAPETVTQTGPVVPEVQAWRALYVGDVGTERRLKLLAQDVPKMKSMGVNTLIVEVNYNFQWTSHPELIFGSDPISKEGAAFLAQVCHKNGVRLVPMFQCLSLQSRGPITFPLLAQYPQLDMLPGLYPGNEGLYAREWDPFNPKVNQIVFALLDELVEAFQADAVHVGMDRVFLLGHKESPGTFGTDNAMVFARVANELHHHLTVKRGLDMLLWGDRLIDGAKFPYGALESSLNDTADAVRMLANDIIVMVWTNEARENYDAVNVFLDKGFRVVTAAGPDLNAANAMVRYNQSLAHQHLLGHTFISRDASTDFPAWERFAEGLARLQE